jgi:coenzyme F420 hydrogenase subunit beta
MPDFPLKSILGADLCSSCGVCVGICPVNCLAMKETGSGEYRPELINDTCTRCGLCERVCPFGSGPDEDEIAKDLYGELTGIQHTSRGGYMLSAFCGGLADRDLRLSRTSGGIGAWLLGRLLESGIADRVVAVRECTQPGHLFEFAEFAAPCEVHQSSKSCYYPVEISECLERIKKTGLTYAIVGVPCLIKAVQKARRLNQELHDRISVTVGLACSCQKTKQFTEYLIRRTGIDSRRVVGFSFRMKDGQTSAGRCLMVRIDTEDGRSETVLHEEYFDMWGDGSFTFRACSFCDDHFSETADIVLMDAKHLEDPEGTTVAISRTPRMKQLLEEGLAGGALHGEFIDLQTALDSQNRSEHWKRISTACMQRLCRNELPEGFHRRVAPVSRFRRVDKQLRVFFKERRRIACRQAFEIQRAEETGTDLFWKVYRRLTCRDRFFEKCLDVCIWPKKLAARILRRFLKRSA